MIASKVAIHYRDIPVFFLVLHVGMAAPAQNFETLFDEAAALTAHHDYSGAARKYQSALRLEPKSVEAMSNLAVMYQALGRYADAVETAERALEINSNLLPANLVLGLSLIRINRSAESIAPLERVRAQEPANRDAILGLAAARVGLNELDAAVELYTFQVKTVPADAQAWYALAVCYERMAESASNRLSRMQGGMAYFKRFLGEFLLERGNDQLALEALAEAASLDANQPGINGLLMVAECRVKYADTKALCVSDPAEREPSAPDSAPRAQYLKVHGLADAARTAFQKFVGLAPDSWQAHLLLGDLDRQRRDFDGAIEHYEAAAKVQPDSPAPFLGLGTVYWELGRHELAKQNLHEVLKRSRTNLQAMYELGDIAIKEHRDEDAVSILQSALHIDPKQAGIQADLGKAYYHLGRYADAVVHLRSGAAIDTFGDIHFQLGQALKQLGRIDESRQALQKSKELRDAQRVREEKLKGTR